MANVQLPVTVTASARATAGRIPAPMRTTSSNGIARSVGFNTSAATLGFELLNREIGEILAAGVS